MSAFIIGKETMDHVVSVIQNFVAERQYPAPFGGLPPETAANSDALGQALYAVNLDAIVQRYPGDSKEHAPGPCDISEIHENYRYTPPEVTAVQGFKSLRCLIYQCSEGDVPDVSPVYKGMEAISEILSGEISTDSPEYNEAAWD